MSYENVDKLQFMHAITISASAWIAGRTIHDCNLAKHGVKVKKVKRAYEEINEPSDGFLVAAGDVLIISGKPRRVERAERKILDGH